MMVIARMLDVDSTLVPAGERCVGCLYACVCVCVRRLVVGFGLVDGSADLAWFGNFPHTRRAPSAEEQEEAAAEAAAAAMEEDEGGAEGEKGKGKGQKKNKKGKLEARLNVLLRVHPNHPL